MQIVINKKFKIIITILAIIVLVVHIGFNAIDSITLWLLAAMAAPWMFTKIQAGNMVFSFTTEEIIKVTVPIVNKMHKVPMVRYGFQAFDIESLKFIIDEIKYVVQRLANIDDFHSKQASNALEILFSTKIISLELYTATKNLFLIDKNDLGDEKQQLILRDVVMAVLTQLQYIEDLNNMDILIEKWKIKDGENGLFAWEMLAKSYFTNPEAFLKKMESEPKVFNDWLFDTKNQITIFRSDNYTEAILYEGYYEKLITLMRDKSNELIQKGLYVQEAKKVLLSLDDITIRHIW